MRRLVEWIEAAFAASAFAEEGEAETARQILREAGERDADRGEGSDPRRRPGADRRD